MLTPFPLQCQHNQRYAWRNEKSSGRKKKTFTFLILAFDLVFSRALSSSHLSLLSLGSNLGCYGTWYRLMGLHLISLNTCRRRIHLLFNVLPPFRRGEIDSSRRHAKRSLNRITDLAAFPGSIIIWGQVSYDSILNTMWNMWKYGAEAWRNLPLVNV